MTDTLAHVRDLIGDRLFECTVVGDGPHETSWHRCLECGVHAEHWWDVAHAGNCSAGILIDTINAFEDPE